MEYVALYRKYRPQDFNSLVGQEHVRTALSNALLNNRIAHAYLFAGPRGTGKTSVAKIMAKAVNCQNSPTPMPCNVCPNCLKINSGTSMDVFEIDAASNRGIDSIKALRDNITFLPVEGNKRVYIIDEAHMLTTEAFNALLKTLEEPPEHVLFILATTETHKIPATILSRCQRYDFKRLTVQDIVNRLQEVVDQSNFSATEEALNLIASYCDGGMRDALSLLDQCMVMSEGEIDEQLLRSLLGIANRESIRQLIRAIADKNVKNALDSLQKIIADGKDIKQLIADLTEYFRGIMLFKAGADFDNICIVDDRENLQKMANLFSQDKIIAAGKCLHETTMQLKSSLQPRITVEFCLLELCQIDEILQKQDLVLRIERLEQAIKNGKVELSVNKVVSNSRKDEIVEQEEKPKQVFSAIVQKTEDEVEPPKEKSIQAIDNDIIKTDLSELDKIWQDVLKKIQEQKKGSVHACAMQAKLVDLQAENATIGCENPFLCERLQTKDFNDTIKQAFLDIYQKQLDITIVCSTKDAAEKKQTNDKKTASKPSEQIPKQEELPDIVQSALNVFGGQVYKLK